MSNLFINMKNLKKPLEVKTTWLFEKKKKNMWKTRRTEQTSKERVDQVKKEMITGIWKEEIISIKVKLEKENRKESMI